MKFTSGPTISANPNPRVSLAAVVEFETDTVSRAFVEVSGDGRAWQVQSGETPRTQHRVPLVGLRPEETCAATVAVEDAGGNRIEALEPLSFAAPPLPDEFPPFEVTTCIPEKREPGAMLFNIRHSPASEHLPGFGVIVAVDREGEVVWYYRIDEAVGDVRRLANGNILYVADGRVCEIDLLGDTVAEWYAEGRWRDKTPPPGAIPVAAGMFHHAVIELPSGNIAVCSMEIRDIEGFPLSEGRPPRGNRDGARGRRRDRRVRARRVGRQRVPSPGSARSAARLLRQPRRLLGAPRLS